VRGALEKRSEEVYASFGDGTDAKDATPKHRGFREVFLRLVDITGPRAEALQPVRRRVAMTDFNAAQARIQRDLVNQKLL